MAFTTKFPASAFTSPAELSLSTTDQALTVRAQEMLKRRLKLRFLGRLWQVNHVRESCPPFSAVVTLTEVVELHPAPLPNPNS